MDVRHPKRDKDGVCHETYLGVCFTECDQECQLGQPVRVAMELMYHPRVDYSEVQPECTFTIREGGKIVGYGTVLSRVAQIVGRS